MNPLLQLKGQLHGRPAQNPRGSDLPTGCVVTSRRIAEVADMFRQALAHWPGDARCEGVLLDVHYDRVVPKSRRLHRLLHGGGKGYGIVGARFERSGETDNPHHVITHYVPRDCVERGIRELEIVASYVREVLGGQVDGKTYAQIGRGYPLPDQLKASPIKDLICDCIDVADIAVPSGPDSIDERQIVNIFKTNVTAHDLIDRFDFVGASEIIDDTTFLLDPVDYASALGSVRYLVSMTTPDEYDVALDWERETVVDDDDWGESQPTIPPPRLEPIVGVIDTLFDTSAYFASWVEYTDELPEGRRIFTRDEDYEHGTSVTSLIVDGPSLNPDLDDGCGRFRVRHFGVAQELGNSQRRLMADIERIVRSNPRIHVWNLSLGTREPAPESFESPLGSLLDRLQAERSDLLFVVAGTNDARLTRRERIGCPADSLNSIVVNAVRRDGRPGTYVRRGPVLSFFNKPDVAAVGGDVDDPVMVFHDRGVFSGHGTSLAAPWITRKAAYLMEVVGLPRDIAKALIVNAAIPWEAKTLEDGVSNEIGYGIVPRHISEVLESPDDEIRFFISGVASQFDTATYELPVPFREGWMPYKARMVLSYAPPCDRAQGVDYTMTELEPTFGPIKASESGDGKRPNIAGITNVYTHEPAEYTRYEENVRAYGRKWDNLKVRAEACGSRAKGRRLGSLGNRWGLRLRKMARWDGVTAPDQRFGIVLTLKAVDRRNRIADFLDDCRRYGWRVTELTLDLAQTIDEMGKQDIDWS